MKNKDYTSDNLENKEYTSNKPILSKYDYELFDESKDQVEKLIRVKRIASKQNERWRILVDNEPILTVEGVRLSKKEKEYLRTAAGFNFLLESYKIGINTVVGLKAELKKKIK